MHKARGATLITTKPVDLDLTAGSRVKGEDCVWHFLLIPLSGKFYPSFKNAVENALEIGKGDVLLNVEMYHLIIPLTIVAYSCAQVEGTVATLNRHN